MAKRRVHGVTIAGVTLASLVCLPHASAEPTRTVHPYPGFEQSLAPGLLVDLGTHASHVQFLESEFGGAVSVLWLRRAPGTAGGEVWARTKQADVWLPPVRLSAPGTPAVDPRGDLDDDGSLLVAWGETTDSGTRIVSRRLTGSLLSDSTVHTSTAEGGPWVGAGAHHDAVAWTAEDDGLRRVRVSTDAGTGFKTASTLGTSGWRHDVIDATVAVNADGPQVHVVHLTHDAPTSSAQATWSVFDPTSGWVSVDDLGPRQHLTTPPETEPRVQAPAVAVAPDGRAVLGFVDADAAPSSAKVVLHLAAPGNSPPLARLSEPTEFSLGTDTESATFHGLRSRRGIVLAAHSAPTPTVTRLLEPGAPTLTALSEAPAVGADTGVPSSGPVTDASRSQCANRPDWFFAWQGEAPDIHCFVPGYSQAPELWSAVTGRAITWGVAPEVGGTVQAAVPDPLHPAAVLTEHPRTWASQNDDHMWLADHSEGGDDRPHPFLRMTQRRALAITGTLMARHTLTVRGALLSPTHEEVEYRWFVDSVPVVGVTGPTLTVKSAWRGRRISVTGYHSRLGHHDFVASTTAAGTVKSYRPGRLKRLSAPRVTGKLRPGRVVKVSTGRWSPAKVTVKRQWYVGGRKVKRGGTKPHLRITRAMAGKRISVAVTVSRPLYASQTVKISAGRLPARTAKR